MFEKFDDLKFDNYKDFYNKCEKVKEVYQKFYEDYKRVGTEVEKYRDYVYSRKMYELEKNAVWDYLNGYLPREFLRKKVKYCKEVFEDNQF